MVKQLQQKKQAPAAIPIRSVDPLGLPAEITAKF
jgi:hypothetical protein